MDAKGFDFSEDVPLPRVCRHCKWAGAHNFEPRGKFLMCSNQATIAEKSPILTWKPDCKPTAFTVSAISTCEHWEERE